MVVGYYKILSFLISFNTKQRNYLPENVGATNKIPNKTRNGLNSLNATQ